SPRSGAGRASGRPHWSSWLCLSRRQWAVASPGRIPFRCENCAVELEDAKRRIEQHSELHAFISISDETGDGPIVAVKDLVDVKPAVGSIDTTAVVPLSRSLDTLGPMAPDVATAAQAFAMMTGEDVAPMPGSRPRFGVPASWVHDLDEQTSRAWALVSRGIPEIQFVDHGPLFRDGLTILMVEATVYHRLWMAEQPDKYGADVLTLLRRGLEILAVDYEQARAARPGLQAAEIGRASCRESVR